MMSGGNNITQVVISEFLLNMHIKTRISPSSFACSFKPDRLVAAGDLDDTLIGVLHRQAPHLSPDM